MKCTIYNHHNHHTKSYYTPNEHQTASSALLIITHKVRGAINIFVSNYLILLSFSKSSIKYLTNIRPSAMIVIKREEKDIIVIVTTKLTIIIMITIVIV